MRPSLPLTRLSNSPLTNIIHAAWDAKPRRRPSFKRISQDLEKLKVEAGSSVVESPRPPRFVDQWADSPTRASPDMHPISLPGFPRELPSLPFLICMKKLRPPFPAKDDLGVGSLSSPAVSDTTLETARGRSLSPVPGLGLTHTDGRPLDDPPHVLQPRGSRASTISFPDITPDESASETSQIIPYTGYDSPPLADEVTAHARDERRYRMLLQHEYHTSCTYTPYTHPPAACQSCQGLTGCFRSSDVTLVVTRSC